MTRSRKRVVILISGRGSNMVALIRAAKDPSYPAEIVGIISDNPDAAGLKLAAVENIPARAIPRKGHADKAAHEAAISAALEEMQAEIVCLAGYMRLLTADFVDRWKGRMINIHPSLLPSFRGLDTHGRALDAGLAIHGCTVHFVTPDMDDGPIIMQAAVSVQPGDDADRLAARVLAAEHQIYPLALRMLALGEVRMEGARAVLADPDRFAFETKPFLSPRPLPAAPDGNEPVDLELLARSTP
jgi:formyltetrahydrofolate-dependent phosphoribosylglycinamide formyltransferase